MERFLASFLIALAVLVGFVYAVRQSAFENGQNFSDLYFDAARKNIKFNPTDEEMISGWPFLVDGEIISEEADSLVIEFTYVVSPEDNNTYRITFTPPSSDFKNDIVSLRPGPNKARVTVFFNPDSKIKRIYKGRVLSFYIYRQLSERQEQQVFSRRAIFEKKWRKPRRVGFYEIRPAEFYTK